MDSFFSPALLTSLFSVGFGKEIDFHNLVKDKYKEYLEKLIKTNIDHAKYVTKKDAAYLNERFRELYTPIPFLSWGNFDLVFLTLVDDFDIIHKLSILGDHHVQQFLISYTPKLEEFQQPRQVSEIFSQAFREKYAYIGISQMKFNSIWTNILGEKLVEDFFISFHTVYKKKKFDKSEIFLMRSLGWGEIQFIIFSNSYKELTEILLSVRESTIKDFFPKDNFPELRKAIESDLLVSRLVKKTYDPACNHVFQTSYSIYGLNFEVYKDLLDKKNDIQINNNPPKGLSGIDKKERNFFFTEIACKPGHLSNIHSIISRFKKFKNPEVLTLPGKQDYLLACIDDKSDISPGHGINAITDFLRLVNSQNSIFKKEQQHILKTRSTLIVPCKSPKDEMGDGKHYSFLFKFEEISQRLHRKIEDIRDKCLQLSIPKNLIFELEHIISSYTNCINNYWVLDAFIELNPSINWLIDFLLCTERTEEKTIYLWKISPDESRKISKSDMVKMLKEYAQCFKDAFTARFSQTYAMNEFTDFSIEFRGSLYQALTGLNGLQGALLSLIEDKKKRSGFILICGEPITQTLPWPLGSVIYFNYHSIFEPLELYTIYHELAHFFFEMEWNEINQMMSQEIKNFVDSRNLSDTERRMEVYDLENLREDVEQIFADIFAFHFGFVGNKDIFSRLFWGRYQSLKDILFRNPNEIHIRFGEDLCRYLLVVYPRFRNSIYKYLSHNNRDKVDLKHVYVGILEELIEIKNYDEILNVYLEMWFKGLGDAKKISEEFLFGVLDSCIDKVTIFKNVFYRVDQLFEKKLKEIFPDFFKNEQFQISKNYEKEIDRIRYKLAKGQPYQYDLYQINEEPSSFKFAQMLLFAYCSEAISFIDDENPCLIRTNGSPSFRKGRGCLYFDPLGGTFVCDPDFRRNHFNLKLATISSFWDFSQKLKRSIKLDLVSDN